MIGNSQGIALFFLGILLLFLEEVYAIAILEKLGIQRNFSLAIILLCIVSGLVVLLINKALTSRRRR